MGHDLLDSPGKTSFLFLLMGFQRDFSKEGFLLAPLDGFQGDFSREGFFLDFLDEFLSDLDFLE